MSRRPTDDVPGSKIAIKIKQGVLFIDPSEVIAVEAEGNHVLLVLSSGSHLVRAAICTIAEKLRPYGLVQIHRSALVNACWIQGIHPRSAGEYLVCVRGGKEYAVSRTYRHNLRSLAPLWIGGDATVAKWPRRADTNSATKIELPPVPATTQ
jgi:DNA-binding LytR/AlgR family response regulator